MEVLVAAFWSVCFIALVLFVIYIRNLWVEYRESGDDGNDY